LTDEDNKIIIKSSNERASFAGNHSYILNKKYKSLFLKNKINYSIIVKLGNSEKFYRGLYINESLPDLLLMEIGPVITSCIANKNQVNINTKLTINNCSNVKWIHLIPPSINYYWEIPYTIENNTVNAGGLIFDNDKSYISNGNYILQINFERLGVIQKDINIIDIYGNSKGKNYGLPLNAFIIDDNEKIIIKPEILSKIDYIEIWFYMQIGGEYQKLGINKITKLNEIILKKDLRSNIYSDDNKQIKLKDNTEYFYRIYVYTVKFNNIYYQSMSELKSIEFKKFKYFIF
jgi:hypothetical protein